MLWLRFCLHYIYTLNDRTTHKHNKHIHYYTVQWEKLICYQVQTIYQHTTKHTTTNSQTNKVRQSILPQQTKQTIILHQLHMFVCRHFSFLPWSINTTRNFATMLSFIHVLNLLTHQFLLLFQISLLYKLPVKIYKSLSCNNTRWAYDHNLQDEFWISLRQVISDRGHEGLIAWSISSNGLL